MSVESTNEAFRNILRTQGRRSAQILFPNDFEMYFSAFELVDSSGRTVDYFAFPLNPENIAEFQPEIVNIKKTNAGITVLSNNTFKHLHTPIACFNVSTKFFYIKSFTAKKPCKNIYVST